MGQCFDLQPLEPRTHFAMLPVGIDPANMGKGDWVWLVETSRQAVGASSVQGLVDYLKNQGMKWVIVKAGDGNDGPFDSYTQFNADLIERVHNAGMKIFGYHFIYGGGNPAPKVATTTPEGERTVAREIMSLNPDGLIIDAEGTYETAPNKLATALEYGRAFKQSYPGKLLGHAPFPYVSLHRAFPYYEFGKYADVVMPQAYWKTISIAQTPEKMVDDMEREWHALYDEFRATGKADAVKPIVPIGQGYDPGAKVTPGDEVTRFVNLLKNDTDPASPGGYKGVSFWSVQHHTASIWGAVGAAVIGTPTGYITGYAFNDKDFDGVRDAGEGGVSGRTVYVDADNDGKMDPSEVRTNSNSNGVFILGQLPAGTHRVRHHVTSGWRPTKVVSYTVTLSAGETENGKNFGVTNKGLVSGHLFNDLDADGGRDADEPRLAGWRVFDDVDRDGVWDTNEPSTKSNSSGNYFLNLTPGAKRIRWAPTTGWRGTTRTFWDVSLTAANTITARNFGLTQKALITGNVFADFNENRVRDAAEPGLLGWRVYLDADNDNVFDAGERSALSDAAGDYRFDNLPTGSYLLRIQQQSGWRRTTQSTFNIVLGLGGVASNKLFGEKRIV